MVSRKRFVAMIPSIMIAVMAVFFLVVYSSYGITHLKQREGQAALKSQITLLQKALERKPPNISELKEKLAAAEARLEAARLNSSSDGLTSHALLNILLVWAEESQVQVVSTRSLPEGQEKVEGTIYHVLPLAMDVEGNYSQILAFLNKLEAGPLDNLIVRQVGMTEDSNSFRAAVKLALYEAVEVGLAPKSEKAPAARKKGG
jgi:Tfp pilus assembly protein PilO